ncbi:ATP synthase F1 subunit epsilon [Candidatus Saccharibacteria bacterium]|nr:ATP synthase F1 subunit epsilon [Candidatus Saccharibacteria bacterium]
MMHFQLVSAQGVKFDGEAYEVLVPTGAGIVAVFEDHMPVISAAKGGVVSVRVKQGDRDDEMKHFAVNGGIMQVHAKEMRFISDDITNSEDVNEREAESALARAEELVKGAGTQKELAEAQRVLHHSQARLNVARIKRRHHS